MLTNGSKPKDPDSVVHLPLLDSLPLIKKYEPEYLLLDKNKKKTSETFNNIDQLQ